MSEEKMQSQLSEPLFASYIQSKGARLGLPIAGNFELTPRCNFNCKMCYVHQQVPIEQELSAAEWIELGRRARDKGMLFLLLTGGEPLIRKDFKEIYHELKSLGLMVSINSNASLVNDEMVEFLKNDPPSRMNITLYGGSNETYERLCGAPMYSRVTENIIKLNDAGIPIKLNASITPYNACDIENIYAFAKEQKLRVQATTYMYPPVRINGEKFGDAPARFSAEDAAKHLIICRENSMTKEQLCMMAKSICFDAEEDECTGAGGDTMRCRAGKTAFWVKWNGNMLPCGMFPHEGWSVRSMGFDAAWENVKAYAKSILLPPECASCPSSDNCAACAAACYAESGAFDVKPEYICRFTKTYESILREKYGKEKENEA